MIELRRFRVWQLFYANPSVRLIDTFDEYDKAVQCALEQSLDGNVYYDVVDITSHGHVFRSGNEGHGGYADQAAIDSVFAATASRQDGDDHE